MTPEEQPLTNHDFLPAMGVRLAPYTGYKPTVDPTQHPGHRSQRPSDHGGVVGIRATSLAARLRAVYGRQSAVDAFTGMVSEPHVTGSDLGALQQAIWKKQFESTRDGDRFFYLNDPALAAIQQLFGISARRSLAQIIRANTGAAVQDDVFKVPAE